MITIAVTSSWGFSPLNLHIKRDLYASVGRAADLCKQCISTINLFGSLNYAESKEKIDLHLNHIFCVGWLGKQSHQFVSMICPRAKMN